MTRITTILTSAALSLTLIGVSAPASAADGQWDANHPRRAQTNSRLQNQNRRIENGEKSGKVSGAQAAQMHQEHQAIRSQERADAAQHGGHITKGEQNQLNHEENAESRQIHNEKH